MNPYLDPNTTIVEAATNQELGKNYRMAKERQLGAKQYRDALAQKAIAAQQAEQQQLAQQSAFAQQQQQQPQQPVGIGHVSQEAIQKWIDEQIAKGVPIQTIKQQLAQILGQADGTAQVNPQSASAFSQTV